MRNIIVEPNSPWRHSFPWLRKVRQWAWKIHDRIAQRFVFSGGEVQFLDATLTFPPGVAMAYATPLFWNGPDAYEGPTSQTLATLIGRAALFLDVGSNVGIYSVYAGVMHPQVVTCAFEPVPAIWEKNRSFHQANRLDPERVLNLAVGDTTGPQTLILPIYNTGLEEEQTATLRADSWQANEAHVERIRVQATTLDHFAETRSLPEGFCCLKIDVENHEAAVLRGGREFIQARQPWVVCEVLPGQKIHPVTGVRTNDNEDVLTFVQEFGYEVFVILSDGMFRMQPGDFTQGRAMKDFLLVPGGAIPREVSYLAHSSLARWIPPRTR